MKMNYHLAVFNTKNKAVFLYSILESMGHENFQLVSTPCTLNLGCNYAIKFGNIAYSDIIIKEAKDLDIGIPEIYFADKKNGKYHYNKISI